MSSSIAKVDLFSVPLYSTLLDPAGFDAHRKGLLLRIEGERVLTAGPSANQGRSVHTARDLHRVGDPALGWLAEQILAFGALALKRAVALRELWAVTSFTHGFMTPHTHFPAPWSGCVYLAAQNAASPRTEDRGGKLELLNPMPLAEAFGAPTGVVITPVDRLVLLFPGALSHMVHPNCTDNPRIVVSFNLEVV